MTATAKVAKADQSALSYLISLFTGEWVRRKVTRTSEKKINLGIQSRQGCGCGIDYDDYSSALHSFHLTFPLIFEYKIFQKYKFMTLLEI
jgi:hypothetical protein